MNSFFPSFKQTCLLWLLLFWCNLLSVEAKINGIRFKHLTIKEGLSQNSAKCVLQDEKGFIWIGTEAGLNKYDGYRFTIFESEVDDTSSLSNSFILSLCKDVNPTVLWVGTEHGLNRFNLETETFQRYLTNSDDQKSLSNNRILELYVGLDSVLWVGTEKGLNRYNPANDNFDRFFADSLQDNTLKDDYITALFQDRQGILWIGSNNGGLHSYDPQNNIFSRYVNDPNSRNSISDNTVHTIFEDQSGMLWVGTERGGLNSFDRSKNTFTRYKHDPSNPSSIGSNHINVIYEDQLGNLWVGMDVSGLNCFDRSTGTFAHYVNNPDDPLSLSTDGVISIYEDNSGGLWFGTNGGGINIFNRETQKFAHYTLPGINDVRPIYQDRYGVLWVGSDGGGLYKFGVGRSVIDHYRHDPHDPRSISDNRVYAIAEDDEGLLWVGTHGGGLNKFDRRKGVFVSFKEESGNLHSLGSDKIRALLIDKKDPDIIWVGTNGAGLNKFNRKTGMVDRFDHDPQNPQSISNNRIYCMFEDSQEVLWIGTMGGGLNRFDKQNQQFQRFQSDPSKANRISDNYILSIYEDTQGMLWVGTVNGGLNRFDREKNSFRHYSRKHGLPDRIVYDILEDSKGHLWISTNQGISEFNPKTGHVKTYDIKDGLQSNEFNTGTGFKSVNGEMFFGGINGFNAFYPDSIKDNTYIPPIVITDFQLFNKKVPIEKDFNNQAILKQSITMTNEIVLSHRDKVFSFEFAALDYVSPEKNRYAYIMEGLEKNLNFVGNRRFVSYTGIPPGKYVFRVRGSNSDGVWNEEGSALKITIVPPFWRSWWFGVICVILLLLLAGLYLKWQIEKVKRQRGERERRKMIETFSKVLEQGHAAVYRRVFESDNYEYMGDAIRGITGYEAKEFSFSFWHDVIIHTEMVGGLRDLTFEEVYQRVEKGEITRWISDMQMRAKSGEIRWIRDMATAVRDERTLRQVCVGILFDITDRKQAEAKLAQTSKELRKSTEELKEKNQEMEADLNMAREVQMAFLDKHPQRFPEHVPAEQSALQFFHRYLPAETLAGDFFDIFPISEHEVGVLICDVMGHGTRASLLTAYIQGLIEELLPIASNPSSFMKKLNIGFNSIMSQFQKGMFATVFYFVMNTKTGRINFANAGHPGPLLLRRREGLVESVRNGQKSAEPALGLFEDYAYTVHEVSIDDGDDVLLFTDGLYEVEDDSGQIFGKKRLLNSLQKQLSSGPEELLDQILGEVKGFSDTKEFKDDVCVVSMHVNHAVHA